MIHFHILWKSRGRVNFYTYFFRYLRENKNRSDTNVLVAETITFSMLQILKPLFFVFGIEIVDFLMRSCDVEDPVTFNSGDEVDLRMIVQFNEALSGLIYGLTIRTVDGVMVFGENTRDAQMAIKDRSQNDLAEIGFKFMLYLLPGEYFLSLGVAQDDEGVDNFFVYCRCEYFLTSFN